MKIERINSRAGGTPVKFPATAGFPAITYHFAPERDGGPHVAMVTNEAHIKRLLSMPEGYRECQEAETLLADPDDEKVRTGNAADIIPPDLTSISDERLAEVYQLLFGKAPHPRAARDTIIAKIETAKPDK